MTDTLIRKCLAPGQALMRRLGLAGQFVLLVVLLLPSLSPLALITVAGALARLDTERALVVSSADGLDEISTSGPTHVVEGGSAAETTVYQTGTLYGEWLDGTPFEGNRYVDRYVVSHGKIVRMEVWNDSAEWLMVRAGLAKP